MKYEARMRQQLKEAAKWRHGAWQEKVAKDMQKAVTREAAVHVGKVICVVDDAVVSRLSRFGECVCITCGVTKFYNAKGMQAGHFVGRGSVVFDERGVNPQCYQCNQIMSGHRARYHSWMLAVHGPAVVNELILTKNTVTKKYTTEELCAMRIGYMDRWRAAEKILREGP